MSVKVLTIVTLLSSLSFSLRSYAMTGANGHFTVELGPIKLGDVVMESNCSESVCSYETRIKGSFMFISAKINENGTYKLTDKAIIPIATHYAEKIGSKRKTFSYDFLNKTIQNKKNNKQTDLPDNVYPFIPLINQVILDLKLGGPQQYYEYLSKQKIKRATISSYSKKTTENGIIHHFVGKEKDDTLEFFFLDDGNQIELEKIAFGSFHMSRKP
ncbi:hypothetical protein [Vibrio sp. MA40-2]|uniref:hypothetical protein n=1 Tax=Vibrio sp. MA40-2 TaxID=3391828 RepID=UPI0039A516F5